MPIPPLLFIAGVPSSGKSHFASWLASERGYLHIDAEMPKAIADAGLQRQWDEALNTGNCAGLADELRSRGVPAVFNWGFPIGCLPLAAALKTAGFASWWFDADIPAARLAHAGAGKSLVAFDQQVAVVVASRASIEAVFSPNILVVLHASGERASVQEIYAHIENVASQVTPSKGLNYK